MRVKTFYEDDPAVEGELIAIKAGKLCVVQLDHGLRRIVRHADRVTPRDEEARDALEAIKS